MKLDLSFLAKRFDSQIVLDSVSLQVDNIHALVLLGPSGGGKSTLLRIIAGLEYPDHGTVSINNKTIRYEEDALLIHRRQIGVVFQSFNLFPHLSALRNITLPLEIVHSYSPELALETSMALLKRFKLESHAHKPPSALSGGQRQRIAIARALATRPSLLLFDEPTSALDPEMTSEVLDMILELRTEKRDLILVTHELGFAKHVADQIAILDQGKIVEFGNPEQIFTSPQSVITQAFFKKTLKY
ncbi:MAG: amino acid ABC transporter ATP-binding protein [Verrucomicrobiota bacterium]